VQTALADTGYINSRQLSATNMPELLNLAHAIEVGAINNLSSRYQFSIEQRPEWLSESPRVQQDDYFTRRDEFIIRLTENEDEQSQFN
jgi:hypothetical protein